MSEAVAEETETEQSNDEATKPVEFQDDMQRLAYEQIAGLITRRNHLASTANAANGNALDLKEQLTEESDDPEIVEARDARDAAINLLEELVAPKVKEMLENATEGLGDIETELKDIDDKLKPGMSFYKKLYGDDAAKELPSTVRLRGVRIGNAGTGGRRVRGFNVTVTVDGEVEEFENFASAAKYLDVETSQLQEAFFNAAGNPKQVKDAPDKVSFQATFTEVDEDENETEKTATVLAYRPETEGDESE